MKKSNVVSVPIHFLQATQALTAGAFSLALRPDALGLGLSSISDGFELFRIAALRVRIASIAATHVTAGVVPS